ncbi:MAG: hypothetical protein WBX25_01070 [Rhodomicrobium sp.]
MKHQCFWVCESHRKSTPEGAVTRLTRCCLSGRLRFGQKLLNSEKGEIGRPSVTDQVEVVRERVNDP